MSLFIIDSLLDKLIDKPIRNQVVLSGRNFDSGTQRRSSGSREVSVGVAFGSSQPGSIRLALPHRGWYLGRVRPAEIQADV